MRRNQSMLLCINLWYSAAICPPGQEVTPAAHRDQLITDLLALIT